MVGAPIGGIVLALVAALAGPPPALASEVARLASVCEQCHGPGGNSRRPTIPSLAGISPEYLIGSIGDFRDGFRPAHPAPLAGGGETDMRQIAASLSEAEVEALAYHFSHQEFRAWPQPHDPRLAQFGERVHERYCGRCHSHGGRATAEGAAVLAGQPMDYLRYTFENFLSGRRYVSHKMRLKFRAMYRKHGEPGLVRLVHFYASRQP